MVNIEIYRDYTFMNDDDYKYTLSVEDDFTYIRYHDYEENHWNYEENHWKQTDEIMLPTTFAYEIAKKIIEEYERMNSNGMA